MTGNVKTLVTVLGLLVISLFILVARIGFCVQDTVNKPDGKTLLEERCKACHSLKPVDKAKGKYDRSRWEKTIDYMMKRGAKLTEEEKQILMEYLLVSGEKINQ